MKNFRKPKFSPTVIDDPSNPNGNVLSHVLESYPDTPFQVMEGFNDCVIGVLERFGMEPVLVYDKEQVIQELMDQSTMTRQEAMEWYEVNQLGSWVGDLTPAFLDKCLTI